MEKSLIFIEIVLIIKYNQNVTYSINKEDPLCQIFYPAATALRME